MKHVDSYEKGHCIGCGLCKVVCPVKCISIIYNDNKEYQPVIDETKCISCGMCVKYCVHSAENLIKENNLYDCSDKAELIGISDCDIWHAKVSDESKLIKSTSGGIATEIIGQMLSRGLIDSVIHAINVPSKIGEEHYKVIISKRVTELEQGRGTVYGPLRYDAPLSEVIKNNEKILVVGTPCIIRAIKKIFSELNDYKRKTLYTCSLICSHSVSGMFTDALANYYRIEEGSTFTVNLRKKTFEMKSPEHFFTSFISNKVIEEDRYLGPFTRLWRRYSFAMGCCIDCRDFWGREADFSVKDAWGAPGKNERAEVDKAVACDAGEQDDGRSSRPHNAGGTPCCRSRCGKAGRPRVAPGVRR